MSTESASLVGDSQPLVVGEALAEQAYRLLRDAILEQRLPAGTRLSVPDVARRLGISRSPAREAIARVAADGLVHIEPRRGAVVASITRNDLVEIYELREVLEGLACRQAAARINEEQLAELRTVMAEHRAAIEANDVPAHKTLDQRFHAGIRQVTGNQRLIESLDRLRGQVMIAMDTTRRLPGGMLQAFTEHQEILAALAAHDPDRAEAAARAHIGRLLRGLKGEERPG